MRGLTWASAREIVIQIQIVMATTCFASKGVEEAMHLCQAAMGMELAARTTATKSALPMEWRALTAARVARASAMAIRHAETLFAECHWLFVDEPNVGG
mmetsp:Transcript_8361/g.12106  ORF Transcript_8361/g.12106 Transcript_8361/m.12106 type:complete len:99 (-) Transcript_8361:396-692(-)